MRLPTFYKLFLIPNWGHNYIAIVDKWILRKVFLTSMINLQTIIIPPPQPHNWSKAPIQYLHFFG